jgi:hypothetical protein
MKIKPGDIIIGTAALCFIVFFSLGIYTHPATGRELHIISQDKEYIYTLQTDEEINIPGPLGTSVIHIENNRVYMHTSPCPLQLCVEKGAIENPGEWIACLPNKILIIIKGKGNDQQEIDIISQ